MSLSILAAFVVAGCASASSTARFASAGDRISFDYPAAWHVRTYPMPAAPFSTVLVWLSPQRMHVPCVTRRGTHNTTITCRQPISRLRRDSILAYWTSNGAPGGPPRLPGGTPISVGGRHATWLAQNGAPQEPSLGETEAITVVVPVPATHGGWDQLTALLRGPHTAAL